MTYEELKKIAQPHIREHENLPSNSLLLLAQLHIPYKTENQCQKDFSERINPLKNVPAFLYIDSDKNKTLYFSMNTQYYNFYIFHEIAHYLLGHESNSPQNEIDADMLACILAAPIENLPSNLKSARDLSTLCQIPIDKAEMYWQEIKDAFSNRTKKLWIFSCITCLVISFIIISLFLRNYFSTEKSAEEPNIITTITSDDDQNDLFYITSSGTHYHLDNCKHIKYKNNIIHISKEEVEKLGLKPCEDCIK